MTLCLSRRAQGARRVLWLTIPLKTAWQEHRTRTLVRSIIDGRISSYGRTNITIALGAGACRLARVNRMRRRSNIIIAHTNKRLGVEGVIRPGVY